MDIADMIQPLGDLRILLLGDVIIDEYVYCQPLGQSLKNPLVVHKYVKEERFGGGVLAVANQLSQFCKSVHVISVVGDQTQLSESIPSRLARNVRLQEFIWPGGVTVIKRRYLYENIEQKVFELCYIRDEERLPGPVEADMTECLGRLAPEFDVVMISDYGHGAVTEAMVRAITARAKFVAVNAQTNSANMGFNLITKKYKGLNFAIVDESEARLAMQERHEDIQRVGERLLAEVDSDRLIVTRGRHGSVGFGRDGSRSVAPGLASSVVDRVGAGDACFAVMAPCCSLGMPMELVAFIGNAVGALAVQIVGNREPVMASDLFKFMSTLLK
jgi:bifunctional ADP-heptose synthase (sugar kinase/adenylyltransferase)